MEQPKTINIDGQSYEVDQFSAGVQQAVYIYNKFTADLQNAQLEVMKLQAAIQQVGQQITEAVKEELKKVPAPNEDDDKERAVEDDGIVAEPIEQTE